MADLSKLRLYERGDLFVKTYATESVVAVRNRKNPRLFYTLRSWGFFDTPQAAKAAIRSYFAVTA